MKGAINLNNKNCRKRRRGCMNSVCERWGGYPYYPGPCADANGCYNNPSPPVEQVRGGAGADCRGGMCSGMFVAYLPMAVSANGMLPLVTNNPCRNSDFAVNSGLITLEEQGTYLATYSVRVPEGAALNTTLTLNVDDASQSSAITQIAGEGTGTSAYSAQAIFEADAGTTVSLRTSDAISVTDPSVQPLVSLSLVQLSE